MSDNRIGNCCSQVPLTHASKCKVQLGVSIAVEIVALAALAACAVLGITLGCIVAGAVAGAGLIVLVCLAVRYAKARQTSELPEESLSSNFILIGSEEESESIQKEPKIDTDPSEASSEGSACDIPVIDLKKNMTISLKEAEKLVNEKEWRQFTGRIGEINQKRVDKLGNGQKESSKLQRGDFIASNLPCKDGKKFIYAVQHWDPKKNEPEMSFCEKEITSKAKCQNLRQMGYFDRRVFEKKCWKVIDEEVLSSRCVDNNSFWSCEVFMKLETRKRNVHAVILYQNFTWKFLNFSDSEERDEWIFKNSTHLPALNVREEEKKSQEVPAAFYEKIYPRYYENFTLIKNRLQVGQYCLRGVGVKSTSWALIVGGNQGLRFFRSAEKAQEVAQQVAYYNFDELSEKLLYAENSLNKQGQLKTHLTQSNYYVKTELTFNEEKLFVILYHNPETSEIDFRTFTTDNFRNLYLQGKGFKEMRHVATSTNRIYFINSQHDELVVRAEKELNNQLELAYRIYNIPAGQKNVIYTVVFKGDEGECIKNFDSEELRNEFIQKQLLGFKEKGALERIVYGTLPCGIGNEGIARKYHLSQFLGIDMDCFVFHSQDEALKETPYIMVRAQRNLNHENGPAELTLRECKSQDSAKTWVEIGKGKDLTDLVANQIKDHKALQTLVNQILPKEVEANHFIEKRITFEEKEYDVIVWGEGWGQKWKIFSVDDDKRKQELLKRELNGYSRLT